MYRSFSAHRSLAAPALRRRLPPYAAHFTTTVDGPVYRRTDRTEKFEKKCALVLADGSRFEGVSVGADVSSSGEVVFTTGMVGYPESLTDPSFKGQFITMTYPMIGNYGVPAGGGKLDEFGLTARLESDQIHAAGMVMQEYSVHSSHWESERTLSEWLKDEGIPAISGIDSTTFRKAVLQPVLCAKWLGSYVQSVGTTPKARHRNLHCCCALVAITWKECQGSATGAASCFK